MTPAEAAASLDEPDWIAWFQDLGGEFSAYEAILFQWRRWHWTPVEINGEHKRRPAPATDGIIALAHLGVRYPTLLKERPPGLFEEQHDAHCWFLSQERSWRVWSIKDGWLILNSFGEDWHIDLKKAKWDSYVAKAAAALK